MTDAAPPVLSVESSSWLRSGLDFIYPPACALCQAAISSGQLLCDLCRSSAIGEDGDVCQRCCAPVGPNLDTADGCIHCRSDRFSFGRVFALGAYDGPLRLACLRMKHDPTDRMAWALSELMLGRWALELRSLEVELVVPVPAHWTTRLSRTPRPADAIAHRIAAFLKAPCDLHILRKSRRTPSQTTLSPTRRRENLREAFRLIAGVRLNGARILLVDDVLTTGTTADRSARVLKTAGAEVVHIAVIARGIGR